MNTFRHISMALPVLLLLAACNNDDELQPGTVNIVTSISGPQTRTPQLDANGAGNFETNVDNLQLAIYGGKTDPMRTSYTVGNPSLYWADVVATAGQADTYTFAAWYNGDDALDLVASPSFNVAEATYKDLLLATPATVSVEQTVTLNFSHAMHKLVVNLSYGDGFDDLDKTQVKVTPVNMNAAATIDVKEGTVTAGEASASDGTYPTVTMGSATSCSFILAPQKLTTDAAWLEINLGDQTLTFNVPANYTTSGSSTETLSQLNSGEVLTLNLTIKKVAGGGDDEKTEVVLTTGEIAAWGNQGSYTGNVDYVYE